MIDPVAPEVFAAAQSAAKVIDPLVDGRWCVIGGLAITMAARLNWSMINDLMASIRELVEDEEVFTNLKKIQQKHSHG